MSHYSSEEELGDSLQIKPPQSRSEIRSGDRMERRSHHEASYSSNRSGHYGRREKDHPDYSMNRRGEAVRSSSRHHYQDVGPEREHKKGIRDRLEPPLERRHQHHHSDRHELQSQVSASYVAVPDSPPTRDRHSRHLQKQKKRRKHIEDEEERMLRDIERRREKEKQRQENLKNQEERSSNVNIKQKRSRKSRINEEEELPEKRQRSRQPSPNNDDEMLDLTVSDDDLLPKIEVEDVDHSHSEGEATNSDSSNAEEKRKVSTRKSPNPIEQLSNAASDISSDSEPNQSHSESSSSSSSSSTADSEADSSGSENSQGRKRRSKKDVANGKAKGKSKTNRRESKSDSDKEDVIKIPSDDGEEVIPLSKNFPIHPEEEDSKKGKVEDKPERELTDVEKACIELEAYPPYYPAIQGCRRVEEYALLNRIEEGTYGVVYRAKDKRTNEIVALKRLKMEKEKDGFPITSLREINTLLKAQHENIVTVREIVVGSNTDKIFLVMDYVEHDLKSLMETLRQKKQEFIMGEVKCLLIQLLRAVAHLHDNWILHRDLKTSNILISHKGILKVGDFGLAREYGSPLKSYTPIVVTLWYRAPELLLGAKEYSTPIDIWSVGCIFGELLKMESMFPGKSEANQLNLIFQTLGTPNDKIWPGYTKLPLLQKMTFGDYPVNKLKTKFGILSETGIDLMNKFLTYNPAKRVTAADALKHSFFREAPLPIDPSIFPTWPAKSEMGVRKHASPKPPSGGRQYKDLKEDDSVGFFVGVGDRKAVMGAGFSLKF